MQNLPPTQAALIENANRTLFQCSVWLTSLKCLQNVPDPANFGWTKSEDIWKLQWSKLPEAQIADSS